MVRHRPDSEPRNMRRVMTRPISDNDVRRYIKGATGARG